MGVLTGVLVVLACLAVAPQADRPAHPGRGFSAVPLVPDVADALKAQGRRFDYPVPALANHGRKFNPVGGLVTPLATGAQQKVLVLFVDFTTSPPGGPAERTDLTYFDDMLFGTTYDPAEYAGVPHPTDRTLYNFYRKVSYGKVDVVTLDLPSETGWLQSGHPYEYYCTEDGIHDNGFGPFPQNAQGLVIDAIRAADPFVDFSQYAVGGVVPNLFVIHAGTGAEWSGAYDILWSHSWDLTEGTGSNGFAVDGVVVNGYAMMPEVGGDLTGFAGAPMGPFPPTVGVFAHEYAHVLGLPDQYDYGYESEGTGMLSLMAGGSWNRAQPDVMFAGDSPSMLDAWSAWRLGFLAPVEITSATQVTLPPLETSPVAYKMVVPNSGGKEYFLLENRQSLSFDQGLGRRGIHGLAIYHVDDTVVTKAYWTPNEAQNWKEFRSEGAPKAENGATHYGISLIQADDAWHLEKGLNAGDAGDLYPGSWGRTSFTSTTLPNSSSYWFWGGSDPKYGYSGVTVQNIQETNGTVRASLSYVPFKTRK